MGWSIMQARHTSHLDVVYLNGVKYGWIGRLVDPVTLKESFMPIFRSCNPKFRPGGRRLRTEPSLSLAVRALWEAHDAERREVFR